MKVTAASVFCELGQVVFTWYVSAAKAVIQSFQQLDCGEANHLTDLMTCLGGSQLMTEAW